MLKTYSSVKSVIGPLIVVDTIKDAKYDELVDVIMPDGVSIRRGRVLEAHNNKAIIQMFESTAGLQTDGMKVRFTTKTATLGVSMDMLGRVFNGSGMPIDGGAEILPERYVDIAGQAINPYSRQMPKEMIVTGISTIDVLNTLVRGQKLPIFSGSGLPHAQVAAQIARQAHTNDGEDFAVVFGSMGVTFEEAMYFKTEFERTGAMSRSTLFLNTASDPVVERIMIPRLALSYAEYLAFEKGLHVLVILTDMTNYAEALREVSAARKEIPGRQGYPGYIYTDLASMYERAGCIRGRKGSVTQIPVLSMPEDDVRHVVPDQSGYITEGQIVMNRSMNARKIHPPIATIGSLSRLAKDVRGKVTRKDHSKIADQLTACYSRGVDVQDTAVVLGESSLSDIDKAYLRFLELYEKVYTSQGYTVDRSLDESIELGWRLLGVFPKSELKRIDPKMIEEHYGKYGDVPVL